MEQFIPYGAPPSMTAPPADNRAEKLNNGRVWYTAIMPLLAIYVQSYANNFALGVLMWVCSVAMWVFSLLMDRRYMESKGYDMSRISPFLALIPPVYIYKRYAVIGQRSSAPIVFVMVFAYALFANGFTRYYTMKDSSYTEYVKYQTWSEISAVSAGLDGTNADKTVLDTFKKYAKTEPDKGKMEWSMKKDGVNVMVTASCKEKDFEAVFTFTYDGFSSGDTSLHQVTIDGKTYKGKEAAEKLAEVVKKIKMDDSSSSDSSK
ncbi:hypothetical protein SAMN02910447_01274 [Ruminococcus sp. YE71]|uniref:hypothetical protein n=1 Tax=unclassified Ruminococcus TaxID=2608920 RepID=UPI00088CBEB2|nr:MULTISPECIES: hypothetical protein [unclassified Ruminococcus]SDA17208.1 hypothetical protein SAMN02910446_01274 [Ruminococcus sp. YE78]SFW26488.1 hypothetical protein SAMN02910447_01274 [Ruminococcus sp. YE71]